MSTVPGPSWADHVAALHRLTARLAEESPDEYVASRPRDGADDAALRRAEERLGHPLDPQHAGLLRAADGWTQVVLDGDLLATDELGEGALWDRGSTLLDDVFLYAPSPGLPARDALYPVFVAPYERDVVAVRRDGPRTAGGHEVLWFSDELVAVWPDATQWWAALVHIARETLHYVSVRPDP
ncbi:hypothetical protein [Cellulomonas carbonis]|nr:hypothetical protein [Cellulomonas carbonis]GGB95561.1 hypothetical protein GCM10010972_05350 [Cellulomonas carbonis]